MGCPRAAAWAPLIASTERSIAQALHRRALGNSPSRPYNSGISGVDRPTIGGQFSGGSAHAEPATHCCECQN
jgi:hypothetical protein